MALHTRLAAALLLAATLLLSFQPAHAQVVDNKGTDFYTALMPNLINPFGLELHLTADAPTNVTVNYPVNAPTFSTTVAVNPGAITIVTVPNTASQGWSQGVAQNNAIRAFATEKFVMYTVNRANASSDAALALPVEALNTDYIVASYTPQFFGSEFVVVAAFDDTQVTITPARALRSGQPAGVPFTVTLERGQGWFGISAGTAGATNDLTGTLIAATKPVAMVNGNGCTQVPGGTAACDHIYEVAQPVASWGNSAIAAPLPNRPNGSIYRVMAAEDNTVVQRNGAVVATLNRGQFHETAIVPGPQRFSADKPIFVTQFMTGIQSPGAVSGDPAMGNVVPAEQFLSAYTFSTVGGGQFAQHWLSIIAENDDVTNGTILFNGAPVASSFSAIPGTTLSHTSFVIPQGTHSTASGGTHNISVMGFNSADSYLYPGGARFQFINPGQDTTPPLCTGALQGDTFFGQVTDRLADDPENRGVFFVALAAGATNLSLSVEPFVPGAEVVAFQVTRTDPTLSGAGSVVGTDGAGNTCSVDISIGDDTPPPPPPDDTPPVCGAITLERVNGVLTAIVSSASDPESGIASVFFTTTRNVQGFTGPNPGTLSPYAQGATATFDPTTTPSIALRAERINMSAGGAFVVRVTNGAGLSSNCDPVVSQLSATAPEAFAVEAPYPNPARAGEAVRLAFSVAEPVAVRVSVYDLLGREAARLVDGSMEAGRYEVAWDGRDAASGALAAGVYVVRVEAGAFSQALRVTVLP